MSGDYLNWESSLFRLLGINRNELRKLRQQQLARDVDFKIEKKRIVYTDEGVAKIRVLLNVPAEKSAPASNGALPEPLPEPVRLFVWNARLVNQKIILAYFPDKDPQYAENRVRVRVKSSENFMKFVNGLPMELKARHIQADLYELATPCPRWKGRW